MTYTIVDCKQGSESWHKLRNRITGSRIGKICGHFRGEMTEEEKERLGRIIVGKEKEVFDQESIRRMSLGTMNEDGARKRFEKYISKKLDQTIKVNEVGFGIWNEDERFGASPDGLFEYKISESNSGTDSEIIKTGLEIKCPEYMYKVDIYDSQYDQVILNMKIFELKEYWFCVNSLIDKKFKVVKIIWDEERWNELYEKSIDFYEKYVKKHLV